LKFVPTVVALCASAVAVADDLTPAPPTMKAYGLESPPLLDGLVLGDPAWDRVTPATDFWQIQPDDGQPATQRTEVFIGFDEANLYVGVVAYDEEPTEIITSDRRRDSSLGNNDAFLFVIDGMLDRQNGYVFGTNSAGVEYDGQVTSDGATTNLGRGEGVNLNWDASWQVRSRITRYGWSAEFQIPFRSLRYSNDEVQDWGINFQRNIRRNNEVAFWSPLDRNRNLYRVSDAGTLTGVRPPPQRNLQFTPYGLASAKRGGEYTDTDTDTEFGFDIKYSITPSLTLDATYNTDFAQVEVDEQQVNLDRFNLFFPEKRPFFLENAGQFEVGNSQSAQIFFSRRIGIAEDGTIIPVDGGLRLSGKVGNATNVGLLHMQTEAVEDIAPGNKFTVARVSQELPNRSSVGMIVTDRTGDGSFLTPKADDRNQVYAVDGRWGIGDYVSLYGWYSKSDTPGLDDNDEALSAQGTYSSPLWEIRGEYTEVEENFNPEVGFLSRTDYRNFNFFLQRRIRNDGWEKILEIRPHINFRNYWKFDGFNETRLIHFHLPVEHQSGAETNYIVDFTRDGVIEPFEIVDGVIIPAGTYDHTDLRFRGESDDSQPLTYGVDATVGGRFGGDRIAMRSWVGYRIGETFRSSLSINYNKFDLPYENGEFTANLARLRLSYSFSPKMQIQALVQYNEQADTIGTNLRFSWLQTANSGLFLVYNEVDERGIGAPPTGREFIVKYSHIFDLLN
jgi:hypothetical protein